VDRHGNMNIPDTYTTPIAAAIPSIPHLCPIILALVHAHAMAMGFTSPLVLVQPSSSQAGVSEFLHHARPASLRDVTRLALHHIAIISQARCASRCRSLCAFLFQGACSLCGEFSGGICGRLSRRRVADRGGHLLA
jgi:hypothetical protein